MTGRAHVLVVEDNELVAGAMRMVFESADFRVSTAASLADVGRVVATDPADLVLLDLTLPDGDGLSVVASLRASGARAVVALTGRDDEDVRQQCLDAGCVEVLLKPVPVAELLAGALRWVGA